MNHLALIVLACAAIGAWVHAIRRKETPTLWKMASIPAFIILPLYVCVEVLRTRGVWFSGEAQAAWPVIISMGLGFTAATGGLDHRDTRPTRNA